jgi:Helix-turn-helix domain
MRDTPHAEIAQGATFKSFTYVKSTETFFAWMRGVAEMKALSPTARLIGVRLALHRNAATGQCNPSYQTLADEIGAKARSTAIRAVNSLVKAGWLGPPDSKGGRSNNFVLTIPNSSPSATVEKADGSTSATASKIVANSGESKTVAPAPLNSSTAATERSHQRYPNDKEGHPNDRAAPKRAAHTVRVEREELVTNNVPIWKANPNYGMDDDIPF